MTASRSTGTGQPHTGLPDWVPTGAQHYLEHTESGAPIRELARAAGCHASTILRQIRKVEMRRDDPLVDAALRRLSVYHNRLDATKTTPRKKDKPPMLQATAETLPDADTLRREAMRVLRRMCEPGAVLAVAAEMEKAVVVRDGQSGASTRTAVVEAHVAQALALKNWIAAANTGRIARYHITPAGRTALSEMLHEAGLSDYPPGMADAQQPFEAQSGEVLPEDPDAPRTKYTLGESPLITLSRRRDRRGGPFLSDALVHAGERLREDFELAQMESQVAQNWDHFLTAGTQSGKIGSGPIGFGPAAARARVGAALTDLGPGLSDIVLRCCCYLEGLEAAEKRLGWSARSAKIVLRIALMRLKRHYDETVGPGGAMIG